MEKHSFHKPLSYLDCLHYLLPPGFHSAYQQLFVVVAQTELGLMIHNLHRGLKPEMDAVVKAHSSDEGEEAQEYLRRTKIVTDGVFERYDLEKKFGQWDCVRNL